jgi:endonuclease/exonuclease/phosphatase family metal-dependent hydrolase
MKCTNSHAAVSSLRCRWIGALAGLLALTALVVAGADHRPLPSASGRHLLGPSAAVASKPTLRVGTFNIHSGRNADGDFDLSRTAACLERFDILALNEVRGAYPWQAGDQAELLGRRLGMPWLFVPTTRRWWRDDFGNGLLCSLPVAGWQRNPLSCTRGKGHRNYLLAEVQCGPRAVSVIVTHVDRSQDRAAQLRAILDRFLALPEPAILLGDLNSTCDDPLLAQVLARADVHDAVSEGLPGKTPRRIDWILARGLRGVAAGVEHNGASDHPFVWAELESISSP